MEKEELAITPGILLLVAVLSVGGLAYLGWQAQIIGHAVQPPYYACCSVEMWKNAPFGYAQGEGVTSTISCHGNENPRQCCVRAQQERSDVPFKLLGARTGMCDRPVVAYPIAVQTNTGYGKV